MNKKTQVKRSKKFSKKYPFYEGSVSPESPFPNYTGSISPTINETKPPTIQAFDGDRLDRFYGMSSRELREKAEKELDDLIEKRRKLGEIKLWIGMIIFSIALGYLIGTLISKI
jgi:hypothetical protein